MRKKAPDDDELLELLRRGQVRASDLDEPAPDEPTDVLRDDLDELVVDANELRQRLGLRPRKK